ncbi:NADH kinase pos5 [Coemansia thaxteri]|nr:NADH kinase pos5 [Coemansia thaxteri]
MALVARRGWRGLAARGVATTADIPTRTAARMDRRRQEAGGAAWNDSEADQQFSLRWAGGGPQTVLLVKKSASAAVDAALVGIARWVRQTYAHMHVVVEPSVYAQHWREVPFVRTVAGGAGEYARVVDFVVTLGGDGTFLHVASLFPGAVPPVVPFSMGTLGFLLPFNVADFPAQLRRVVDGAATVMPRMRLAYARRRADGTAGPSVDVTNEVCIHRATYPHLTTVSCFLNGHLLTTSVGDGVIVATPTGSTATRCLPAAPSMLLAPVCPRSLSFRPLMLPSSSVVRLQVHPKSRGRATAFIDGRDCGELAQGECIEISRSPHPLMCVNRDDLAAGWALDINQLLQFNRAFSSPHEEPFAATHPDSDSD